MRRRENCHQYDTGNTPDHPPGHVYDIGPGEPMIVRTPGTAALTQGDAVVLQASDADVLRFDDKGARMDRAL